MSGPNNIHLEFNQSASCVMEGAVYSFYERSFERDQDIYTISEGSEKKLITESIILRSPISLPEICKKSFEFMTQKNTF